MQIPAVSDGDHERKLSNANEVPEHAPFISTMASITPGRANYIQLDDMVTPASMRGDMASGRVRNNAVVESGAPNDDAENMFSESGIVKTTEIYQKRYKTDVESQESFQGYNR